MRIGLDIDDTITAFHGPCFDLLRNVTGKKIENTSCYDIYNKFDISNEDFFRILLKENFYETQTITERMRICLQRVATKHDITFITARAGLGFYAESITHKLLSSIGIPYNLIISSPNQSKASFLADHDVLVEDMFHNLADFGNRRILVNHPWSFYASTEDHLELHKTPGFYSSCESEYDLIKTLWFL